MMRDISRRDFLNGASLAIAAGLLPAEQVAARDAKVAQAGRTAEAAKSAATTARAGYPPALTGLRGSTDAAFEVIHSLALEGRSFDIDRLEPEASYDLVVVGAGLAGLTAAWVYRERRPKAKILILDNNDDFGGHARRTEFTADGRLLLGYGGSESLVAPKAKFAGDLAPILRKLGLRMQRFESEAVFHRQLYPGLGLAKSVFFDRESFGRYALVTGDPLLLGFDEFAPANPGARPVANVTIVTSFNHLDSCHLCTRPPRSGVSAPGNTSRPSACSTA